MPDEYILILGGTSAIARACANSFAEKGYHIYLAGRDLQELGRIAADIHIRYQVNTHYGFFEAEDFASHNHFFASVINLCGQINGILLAFGYMNNEKPGDNNEQDRKIINCNLTGAINILNIIKRYLILQKTGFIIGISSVAGDRGRQSNYIYGAAKAGLSTYLQGLRNELYQHNIRVITIKLGFVDTAMTFGKQGLFLVASPQAVAKKIVAASINKKDVIYVPWFWRYIMLIIKLIPEFIFKRMKL